MNVNDETLNKYYRYAISLTGSSNDAFDLVHEALIKVRDKRMLKQDAYILRTIRNLFLNKNALMENQNEILDEEVESEIDLEKIVADKFEMDKMIGGLSYDERELIFLVEVEGYTYKELEETLGISQGTLLAKVHRAKKKIVKWSKSNG